MAYEKLSPYKPQSPPRLPDSDRRWVQDEFRRLEIILLALIAAIEELRAKVP
jgi:hypothetical protein